MQKLIENNFRILKKPHAYLQTILKAPVKFQKDRTKTMGGFKGTRYLLKIRNHAPLATQHGKPKTVSLRFFSKRRGTIKTSPLYPYLLQRQQALPNCKPISVERPGDARYTTPLYHNVKRCPKPSPSSASDRCNMLWPNRLSNRLSKEEFCGRWCWTCRRLLIFLTLSSLSFWSGLFDLWIWSEPFFQTGVSVKTENLM